MILWRHCGYGWRGREGVKKIQVKLLAATVSILPRKLKETCIGLYSFIRSQLQRCWLTLKLVKRRMFTPCAGQRREKNWKSVKDWQSRVLCLPVLERYGVWTKRLTRGSTGLIRPRAKSAIYRFVFVAVVIWTNLGCAIPVGLLIRLNQFFTRAMLC